MLVTVFSFQNAFAEATQNSVLKQEQTISELYSERLNAICCGNKKLEEEMNAALKQQGVDEISIQEICEITGSSMPRYVEEYDNYYFNIFSEDVRMNGIDYTFRVINVTPKNQKCNLEFISDIASKIEIDSNNVCNFGYAYSLFLECY